jgi:hypothetical protein
MIYRINDFARSQDISPTCLLLLRVLKISSVKLNRALCVDRFFLNPNYPSARILFEFKKLLTLVHDFLKHFRECC